MRLTRTHRIRSSADYQRLARRARRVRSKHFTVLVDVAPQGRSRLGMAVSRKVGKAVVRNKLRRRLREIVRVQLDGTEGLDLVFLARPGAGALEFEPLRSELVDVVQRAVKKGSSLGGSR